MSRRRPFSGRIALALESSGPGGAEQMVLRLAEQLRAAGRDPVVFTLRPGWMTERAARRGLAVRVVPQRPGLDPGFVVRFARELRRAGCGVLHAHEFALGVYGGAAATLAGIPRLATLHGSAYGVAKRRRAIAWRVLMRLGMPVVPVSRALASALAPALGLEAERLPVVHNGVPVPAELPDRGAATRRALRRQLGLPEDGRLLVCVGNLYPVKGHATLLRALPALPGARLAIAGRGAEESNLRALAAELGVANRLHLLGVVDGVDALLRAADLFVHPSRSEGLPLAVLEALAGGVPVVASRVGGIPEAVEDGRSGLLVPPGDPEALAAAIGELLADPERAKALGRAGFERAAREFSVEAMTRRYLDLYAELGFRPAPGSRPTESEGTGAPGAGGASRRRGPTAPVRAHRPGRRGQP